MILNFDEDNFFEAALKAKRLNFNAVIRQKVKLKNKSSIPYLADYYVIIRAQPTKSNWQFAPSKNIRCRVILTWSIRPVGGMKGIGQGIN
jgi:hypothetical protein